MGKVVLAALIALLLGATPAGAATYTVNRSDDPPPSSDCGFGEPCSFREAVLAANERLGPDNIVVRPGEYGLSTLDAQLPDELTGDLDVIGTVRVFGAGRRSTWINDCGWDRAIELHRGNLEIRDMRITGCTSVGDGGGIAASLDGSGTLRLVDMRLDHNNAVGAGGNLYAASGYQVQVIRSLIDTGAAGLGGGIATYGPLTITDSRLKGSAANPGRGGNIAAQGRFLSIRRSSLSGGTAVGGGGNIFVAGGFGDRLIDSSTLERGTTTGSAATGGSLQAIRANLQVLNSTIAHSRTPAGGGGVSALEGTITLFSSTLAGNRAKIGGALHTARSGVIRIRDSLLARNGSALGAPDCFGAVRSLGHNLFAGCRTTRRRSDIRTSRPRLGRFALHGAATRTFSLRRSSPAVDAGSRRCPARDQRNRSRRRACDIGAFEFQGPAPRRSRR